MIGAITELGKLGKFIRGSGISKSDIVADGGIPCVRYAEIYTEYGEVIRKPVSMASKEAAKSALKLESGDIIFPTSGETAEEIGKAAAFVGHQDAYVGGDTVVLRGHGQNAIYLAHALNTWNANRQKFRFATGNSVVHIYQTELSKIQLWLPAPNEQQKIVEILSDCDTVIASLTQERQSTERALTFSRKEIFRPYVCGSTSEKQAESIYKLGELFSERVETGNENLPLVSITMGRGVIPREEVGRKDSSSDDKSKYRRICVGDIGYNTMRMWQGVNGLSSIDGIVSPAYTICIPNTEKIHPDWAAHLFKEKRMIFEFWRHSQGLVNDTLGLKFPAFAEIKIHIPNLQTQSNDIQHMAALFEHQSLLDAQIENLKKHKRGLMQQLLTGKLRVQGAA